MDLDKYKNTITLPMRPIRPKLKSLNPSLEEITWYEDRLKEYEQEKVLYDTSVAMYRKEENKLHNEFMQDALDDVGLTIDRGVKKEVIEKAWSYAWENGHADGQSRVYDILCDLSEIIKA